MHMHCCRPGVVLGGAWLCLQRCAPLLSWGKGEQRVLASPPQQAYKDQLWPKHKGQVSHPWPHPLRCRARHGVPRGSLLLWVWCRVRWPAVRRDSLHYCLESWESPSMGLIGLDSLLSCGGVNREINFSGVPDSLKSVMGLHQVGCR